MRDIYLIDFENVASEGLSGITYLAPEDEVIIFYSNNSKSLSMKMHILIGKSVCKLDYFEATVGGKNALDHQISTWLGYLVGTGAAERNYYIVSRDMGYKFVASFWADSPLKPNVRCVESIRAATRIERSRQIQREAAARAAAAAAVPEEQPPMLTSPEPVVMLHAAPESKVETKPEVQAEPNSEPAPQPEAQVEVQSEVPVEAKAESQPQDQAETMEVQPEIAPAENQEPQNAEPAEAEVRVEVAPEAVSQEALESLEPEVSEIHGRRSRKYRRNRSKSRSAEELEQSAESAAAQHPEPEAKPEKHEPKPEAKPEKHESKAEPKQDAGAKREARTSRKKPEDQKERSKVDLAALLAPYPGLQEAHLQELINGNKRQILCNTLRKQLGQEKGLALYNEIKRSAWR